MKRTQALIVAAIIIGIAIAAIIVLPKHHTQAKAQPVPAESRFSEVKKLSEGAKPACLSENKTADKAVSNIKTANMGYSFGLVIATRIIDIPAGNVDTTVHAFKNNQATGTLTYSSPNQQRFVGSLDSFNYTAHLNPSNKQWTLVKFIACSK